ncbi:MAG: DoxX family membrane protein [Chitinophagaceae bacterium]|nr:MAG: DoxX family membrane protein [Chitinophagaceae bacterium]
MKKRISLYVMCALYLLAGINHFRNPEGYYKIIPPWIGNVELVNTAAGIAEILLALLLIFNKTRRWACYGIIAMLLAFLPAHVYMLQTGFCPEIAGVKKCAPEWALWMRLLLFQPLLIWWAWTNRNK